MIQIGNFVSELSSLHIGQKITAFASDRTKRYSHIELKMRYKISLQIADFSLKSHKKFEANRTENSIKIRFFYSYRTQNSNTSLPIHSIAH